MIDALVLREMHRRCNFDSHVNSHAFSCIYDEVLRRQEERCEEDVMDPESKVNYYVGLWARSGFTSIVILPFINEVSVRMVPTDMLQELYAILETMNHKPFHLITIHDQFSAHANNVNHVRQHYINILAELADSEIISDILSQIHKTPGKFTKLSNDLSKHIRNSDYALS